MTTMRTAASLLSLALALSLALVACKQEETRPTAPPVAQPPVAAAPTAPPAAQAFRVGAIELGSSLGADQRIATPGTTFAPADTIYATVATDGIAPSVTISVRWTYGSEGQLVNESSRTLVSTGPAITEFHISKPDGWPSGAYRIEIAANGSPVGTRDFVVR
jgi:hypothetical protein